MLKLFNCFCGNNKKSLPSHKCDKCNTLYFGNDCLNCQSFCQECGKILNKEEHKCEVCNRITLSEEQINKIRDININLVENEKKITKEEKEINILEKSKVFFNKNNVFIGTIINKNQIPIIIYYSESERLIARQKTIAEPTLLLFFVKYDEKYLLFAVKYITNRPSLFIISPSENIEKIDKEYRNSIKLSFSSVEYISANIVSQNYNQLLSCILIGIIMSNNIEFDIEYLLKSAKFYWKNDDIIEGDEVCNKFIPKMVYTPSFLRHQKFIFNEKDKIKLYENFMKCLNNLDKPIMEKTEESEYNDCEDTDTIEIINSDSYLDNFPQLKSKKLYSAGSCLAYLAIFIRNIKGNDCVAFSNDKKKHLMYEATNQFIKEKGKPENFLEEFLKWFKEMEFKRNDYILLKNYLNCFEVKNFDKSIYQNFDDSLLSEIFKNSSYQGIFIEKDTFSNINIDFTIFFRIIAFISFDKKECSIYIKKENEWYILNTNEKKLIKNAEEAFKKVIFVFVDKI